MCFNQKLGIRSIHETEHQHTLSSMRPCFLRRAFETVDPPLAILWFVLPAQELASCNVADRIHGNPHDTSRGVGPRVVAVQPDIACWATFPAACVHKRASRLVLVEPLHGQLLTCKSIDGEFFALFFLSDRDSVSTRKGVHRAHTIRR